MTLQKPHWIILCNQMLSLKRCNEVDSNGNAIGYSEIYTPSVITGIPPVYLSPTLTNEQAQKIAQDHFQTLGVPDTQLTGPEPLGFKNFNRS